MKYSLRTVNPVTKKLLFLLVLSAIILSLQFTHKKTVSHGKNIASYYIERLNNFEKSLSAFVKAADSKAATKELQHLFFQTRIAYKKVANLTEFYNIYETKMLNGPALKWVDDDNPQPIFEPHGLQVVEENLFSTPDEIDFSLLKEEGEKMLDIIAVLQREKNLDYKFRDELMFEAFQSTLIRLITLGISGFDSPIAQYSLPEAKSTLEGFQSLLSIYKNAIDEKDPGIYEKVNQLLASAINFLDNNASFNSFDRLTFIKTYLSPAYAFVVEIKTKLNLQPQNDRQPLNPVALSLFDTNTFNINAFSPTSRYRMTKERIELGKKLFYDPVLSSTGKRTCGTCHKPELAFTDGLKTALAVDEETYLLRNTPTLWNSVLQKKQFYDSRTSVLENQLSDVVHNQEEMKGSLKESVEKLKANAAYASMFDNAYADENEKITLYNIANAISSYIRSLVALNSRFDLYMRGDERKLTNKEKKGFNLFMGKAKCGTCHFIPLFNGLTPPFFGDSESEVLGVPQTKNKNPANLDPDKGKFNFTRSPIHLYSFKTPTLRNIALTAPYMHNGVYNTLEEVMEFYNNGGGQGLYIAPANQTLPFDKLNLTKKEITNIIGFMRSLTDTALKK